MAAETIGSSSGARSPAVGHRITPSVPNDNDNWPTPCQWSPGHPQQI